MTDVSLCFPARLSILPSAIPPTTIFLGRDFLAQFTGWCKRNVPCLKIPALTDATQWGLPWTAQSADFGKFYLNSLNLAPFLLLNPVYFFNILCYGFVLISYGGVSPTLKFASKPLWAQRPAVASSPRGGLAGKGVELHRICVLGIPESWSLSHSITCICKLPGLKPKTQIFLYT